MRFSLAEVMSILCFWFITFFGQNKIDTYTIHDLFLLSTNLFIVCYTRNLEIWVVCADKVGRI